jgi:hypothetical protein
MNEKKNERKKERREERKNMSMRKVNSPVLESALGNSRLQD